WPKSAVASWPASVRGAARTPFARLDRPTSLLYNTKPSPRSGSASGAGRGGGEGERPPSMELHEALTQISEIRKQMARTEVFRGYRALPVAFSGVLAVAAAVAQALWIPEPAQQISAYLLLWVGTAVVSGLAAGAEMAWRTR